MSRLKPFDFSLFSDMQLSELVEQVRAELRRRQREARRYRGLREGHGPRYRNPRNSAETWSGRGEPPSWVRDALARGAALADLELADNRPQPRDAPDAARGERAGPDGAARRSRQRRKRRHASR